MDAVATVSLFLARNRWVSSLITSCVSESTQLIAVYTYALLSLLRGIQHRPSGRRSRLVSEIEWSAKSPTVGAGVSKRWIVRGIAERGAESPRYS